MTCRFSGFPLLICANKSTTNSRSQSHQETDSPPMPWASSIDDIKTLSVISSSSLRSAMPASSMALRTLATKSSAANCFDDILTAIHISSPVKRRAKWQASRSTHWPIGWMRPLYSVNGIKCNGETAPCSALFQRRSASNPTTVCPPLYICGW